MSSYLTGPISKLRLVIGQTVSQILFCMSEKLLFGSMMNQPFMLMIGDWQGGCMVMRLQNCKQKVRVL